MKQILHSFELSVLILIFYAKQINISVVSIFASTYSKRFYLLSSEYVIPISIKLKQLRQNTNQQKKIDLQLRLRISWMIYRAEILHIISRTKIISDVCSSISKLTPRAASKSEEDIIHRGERTMQRGTSSRQGAPKMREVSDVYDVQASIGCCFQMLSNALILMHDWQPLDYNKIYKQMRHLQGRSQTFHPLKSPDIDRSKSKPLVKTQAPMDQILNHSSHLKIFNSTSGNIKNQETVESARSNTTLNSLHKETIQLWISKYEYVKRDNQLLQSQIVYLNEHINRLSAAKKLDEMDFSRWLNQISKVFMEQLVNCQETIRTALENMEEKQVKVQKQIHKIKLCLTSNNKYKKNNCLDLSYNCQFEELFQTKIQNSKLLTRIKVLEEEIKQLGSKYVSNFQWKFQSINFFNEFEKKLADKSTISVRSLQKINFPSIGSERQKLLLQQVK